MKKWLCKVCGYIYEGPEAPAECPVCHAKSNMFEEVKGELTLAAEHEYGIYAKTVKNNPDISEEDKKLDSILELSTSKLMDRRLQTKVFKFGLAKSIHHARKLIQQRHIRVGHQVVNSPSFMVHVDSEKHIQFAENSPYGGGRPVVLG